MDWHSSAFKGGKYEENRVVSTCIKIACNQYVCAFPEMGGACNQKIISLLVRGTYVSLLVSYFFSRMDNKASLAGLTHYNFQNLPAKLLHCEDRLDGERSDHLTCKNHGCIHAVYQVTG